MNKSDELLLRLQLLLSDQIQNLQKYKSFPNADVYKDAYMEVMKLIPLLNEMPNIKLVCHEGKFWKERDIDKRYQKVEEKLAKRAQKFGDGDFRKA